MSDAYLGEIRMFGGNYAPVDWAFCNGSILSIAQFNALFSLLGTSYGGDGRSNFALPDMRGRIPLHYGYGPGLTPRMLGTRFGSEEIHLSINQIPNHTHALQASMDNATSSNPASDVLASQADADIPYTTVPSDPSLIGPMSSGAVASSGGSESHYNLMPYQCVSFIICTNGLYPPRN